MLGSKHSPALQPCACLEAARTETTSSVCFSKLNIGQRSERHRWRKLRKFLGSPALGIEAAEAQHKAEPSQIPSQLGKAQLNLAVTTTAIHVMWDHRNSQEKHLIHISLIQLPLLTAFLQISTWKKDKNTPPCRKDSEWRHNKKNKELFHMQM